MDTVSLIPAILVLIASIAGHLVTLYVSRTKFKRELKTSFINKLNVELFNLCGDFIVQFSIDDIDNVFVRPEESYSIKSISSFNKLVLFLIRHEDIYRLDFKTQIDALNSTYAAMKITHILSSEYFDSLKGALESVEFIKHKILDKLR